MAEGVSEVTNPNITDPAEVAQISDRLKDDGGPAFPSATEDYWTIGMSTRDWFAGRAMQGFMLGLAEPLISDRDVTRVRLAIENTSRLAYLVADAMLRERDRK